MNTLATWQDHRILENGDALRLDLAKPASTSTARVDLPSTPPEFVELFASLEQRIADVDSPTVLGITSAIQGEGKTTVALHLALSIARGSFKRICLLDLGLTGTSVAGLLAVQPNDAGLIAAVEDEGNHLPTLQVSGIDNLSIVLGGRAPTNPQRLARSPRLAQILEAARDAFDIVIVDLPSTSTGNALPLTRLTDGVVLVARTGATPSDLVSAAIETVGRDRGIGVVMNRTQSQVPQWIRRRLVGV